MGDPQDGFFLSYPHTHDGFLYSAMSAIEVVVVNAYSLLVSSLGILSGEQEKDSIIRVRMGWNIRIYYEREGRIEQYVLRIAVWHHEACRVMKR